MVVKIFSKLGENAKKILNDDYVFQPKLSVKSTTQNGVTYSVNGIQADNGSIEADFGTKFKLEPANVGSILSGGASSNTISLKLFTSGVVSAETILEDVASVSGLKATLSGTVRDSANLASLSTEYVGHLMAFTSGINLFSSSSPAGAADAPSSTSSATLNGSLVLGAEGLYVGGEIEYNASSSIISKYSGAISYSDKGESEILIALTDKAQCIRACYSHAISKRMNVAAEISYRRAVDIKLLTIGFKYVLDELSSVKAKVDSAGGLCMAYIQEIRPKTTFVLASKLNVNQLDKGGHRIGLSLTYDA
jgi:voltage-dependent anion channel protein 2